jgi:hypothetical protein
VEVFGDGALDIAAHDTPGITLGSIEGDGQVFLGANNLTIGSNNLSTTFAGLIQDSGSVTKTGTATLVPRSARSNWLSELSSAPLPPAPAAPDESYWREVRARFLVPPDLAFLNAANLCPMSLPVVEAIE